jgi:formylglycine-generating enzyme required for sulfatase activity
MGVCNDRSLYPDPENLMDLPQVWLTNKLNDGPMETNQCRTTTAAATAIYHMSGNLAEWTSTFEDVTIGATTTRYYRTRGGSFLTYGSTTACDESFVLNVGPFQNYDLGFRCCSAAAP